MRVLMKVEFPVEKVNDAIKEGSMARTVQAILDDLKPEATYFLALNGKRTGLVFLDLADPAQIPEMAEPWFLAFNAKVSFRPVMNPQDLATAGPAIANAVKQHGK